nr:oxysterol-binding protein 2 [Zonotrichia albicollis]
MGTQAEMAHTCRGTINLSTAHIDTEDSCNIVLSNGGRTYHLKANSEVERQRWVTALELAKAKAIRMRNNQSDDSGDEEPASQSDKSELHGPLKTLSSKLEDLSTCNELIAKHGAALQRSLSELENLRLPADSGEKIKAVNERATLFRITSNAMINVSECCSAPPPPPPPSSCPPSLFAPCALARVTAVRAWEVGKMQLGRGHGCGPHPVPLQVNFNEPLSMLQRLTEDLEYHELLDKAVKCESSTEQMCFVAAFSVSSYSTTVHRTAKPFNPLLGETFELDRLEELGFRSLCEQVSHHPPAAAHHVYSRRGWTLWQEITIASKFRGKYLSIMPLGAIHLEFHSSGNHYVWRKVTSTVHNIIVGKLWIDQSGEIEIVNHKSKDKCQLKFTPYSYFSRDVPRKVTGVVSDADGKAHYVMSGTWDEKMECSKILHSSHGSTSTEGKQKTVYQTLSPKVLWRKYPLPDNAENMYFFSELALTLNEPEERVAPTDSRLRPDQRLMESGRWDEANAEKQRLEEKQRAVRRRREAEAVEAMEEGKDYEGYLPLWFERKVDAVTGELICVYKGGYWEAKDKQDWSVCPDIF